MYAFGTFGIFQHRSRILIGVLLCVCIVTVGCVGGTRGQVNPRKERHVNKETVLGMGPKSSSASEDDEASVVVGTGAATAEMPHRKNVHFRTEEYSRNEPTLEERLLANQGRASGHVRHPHVTVPQLPFCKPTKSTVGSGAAGGGGKSASSEEATGKTGTRKEDESGSREYDESIEVVDTDDGVLEADRKILVATLDGKVTLLNRTGHQIWSVKTGPLFSSTISSLQLNENGKWVNLIPSLTGGVYKYDGDSLYPMPFNADSLLKKSFKLSHDVVITGGKELRTFGIDVSTGNIRYECGITGCVSPGAAELNPADPPDQSVVLVVKKQMQTVRAIDSSTGVERWNFSVGTHELALAGVTEGCYHGEQKDPNGKGADFLKIVIPEGRVFGADRENQVVWDHNFETPISQAWVLENGQLVSIDPITNTPLTDVPSLYIGIHNQQFYVQESQTTAEKMERYFGLESLAGDMLLKRKPLKIGWKPPAAIDGVSGSTALSTISPTPNWVSFSPTPNFRPIYIYDKDSVGDTILEGPNSTEEFEQDDDETDSEDEELNAMPELDFSEGITQVIVMSLWFWWKEVLGISLLTAVLLNVIFMKPMMRAVRSQTIREMSVYFQQLWNRWKEEEENRALLARHTSNLLSLPPASEEENNDSKTLTDRQRSTSCSSTGSANSPCTTEDREREIYFTSQYLNEFIPIECLGRGGFGVVFEAKKKIDDRTYAVKRITLPDREKARVRVMREVKALAQLDHRNIVRYFNAWIESPPPGWLEKNDPLWAKTIIGSTSPTMDYPSDMYGSSHFPDLSRRNKLDHSKISVPNTPSDCPLEADEDSYIVFENSTTSAYSKISTSVETAISAFSSESTALLNDTSIPIPPSEDTSVASSTSSAGGGFFARRPTSLSIHSNISSFHDESNREASQRRSIVSHAHHELTVDEEDEENGPVSPILPQDIMYLYIQQELCQKRTLQDWLRAERSRDTGLVVKLFSQIVEAVEYVHSKKLIHRDLKPSNIFLAEVTENGFGVLTVKIGDFGLATTAYAELESDKIVTTPTEEGSSEGQTVRINLTGHVGTHLYMSPEQYHRKPYDYKVDIYSLGLIFFELLVPFTTDMERCTALSGVRKLDFPQHFRDSFPDEFELIQKMISHNPNERPDAAGINSWVKDHISRLNDSTEGSQKRGSGDAFVGRSISSPAELLTGLQNTRLSSSDKKKLKSRFFKTQSVM